jgi:V8-like Glu-specific endopeptidase
MSESQRVYGKMFVAVALTIGAQQINAQVRSYNGVTSYTVQPGEQGTVDYVRAKPMPLPQNPIKVDPVQSTINALTSPQERAISGFSPGAVGSGIPRPKFLGAPIVTEPADVDLQEWGTANLPFSTARADLNPTPTNAAYPYRASGKIFFTDRGSSFVCSGSMIKRGLVVTAAHCVAAFGESRFYTNVRFVPGYRNGNAPFGEWAAQTMWIKTSYYNGTDSCSVSGVVCANDVAVIVLQAQGGAYAGTSTGWYGYAWNGWGFVNNTTHLTQIGYPGCLNNGAFMERNDAQGVKNASMSNNTTYGSLMCGGSSGGPLVANFGLRPALTGTNAGNAANANIVIGVTSWGFNDSAVKQQGASPFTANNISSLVNSACAAIPAACS